MPSRLDEAPIALSFTLNGRPVLVQARPKRSALDVLREGLDLRSLKPGCSPQGICGCCAVLVDDKVRLTCTLPARSLEGKQVCTLEGISEESRAQLARAFSESGALRCGYCAPGLAIQAHALAQRLPDPTDEDIGKALGGHVCRCTGYQSLTAAFHRVAELRRAGGAAPLSDPSRELALGEFAFTDDLNPRGLLHAALVWAPVPHGRLLRVDAARALAVPGVRLVLTGEDLPMPEDLRLDRPALLRTGALVRCVGDAVALVVADTRELAYGARDLVEVEVEALTPLTDVNEAARDPQNLLARVLVARGSLNEALDAPGVRVAKGAFKSQRQEPAFVEGEAALAVPIRGGVHLTSACELPGEERRAVAALLGLPPEAVRVEGAASGGAFGAKRSPDGRGLAALAALRTGRPVKLSLDMEEGMRLHVKRGPLSARLMLGCDAEGRFLGLKALVVLDGGGHGRAAVEAADAIAAQICGPYTLPNLDVEVRVVGTHNPPGGALFAQASAELCFALEGCVDRLAEQLGLDPAALRRQNLADPALAGALDALAPAFAEARGQGLHAGLACAGASATLSGAVQVVLDPQKTGEILIRVPFADVGQGLGEALTREAVRATGLEARRWIVHSDGALPGGSAQAGWTVSAALRALRVALAGWRPGRRAEGQWPEAPSELRAGLAALAVLDAKGQLVRIVLAVPGEESVVGAQGAAHLGLGAALSEEMVVEAGVPDTRLRNLGLVKAALTPPIDVICLPPGALCPPESADLAVAPVAPAIAAALHSLDGQWRAQLPMKDNPAAWSVGVRKTRGPSP